MDHEVRADVVLAEVRTGFAAMKHSIDGLTEAQRAVNGKASRALELIAAHSVEIQHIKAEGHRHQRLLEEQGRSLQNLVHLEALAQQFMEEQRQSRRSSLKNTLGILTNDTDVAKMPATWSGIFKVATLILGIIAGTVGVLIQLGWRPQ